MREHRVQLLPFAALEPDAAHWHLVLSLAQLEQARALTAACVVGLPMMEASGLVK